MIKLIYKNNIIVYKIVDGAINIANVILCLIKIYVFSCYH